MPILRSVHYRKPSIFLNSSRSEAQSEYPLLTEWFRT